MIFLALKYPQTSYLYHTQEIPLFLKGNQTIYPEKMISLHESQSPHLKHGDDKTDLITGAAWKGNELICRKILAQGSHYFWASARPLALGEVLGTGLVTASSQTRGAYLDWGPKGLGNISRLWEQTWIQQSGQQIRAQALPCCVFHGKLRPLWEPELPPEPGENVRRTSQGKHLAQNR